MPPIGPAPDAAAAAANKAPGSQQGQPQGSRCRPPPPPSGASTPGCRGGAGQEGVPALPPLLRSSPGSTPQGPGVFQGHCEPCVPSARLQRRSPAPIQSWALGGSGTLPRAQVGEFINFLSKGLLLFNCWNEKVSRETQPPALPAKRTEALHPSQPQLEAQAGTFELRSWGSLGIESPCFHSGPRLHTYTHVLLHPEAQYVCTRVYKGMCPAALQPAGLYSCLTHIDASTFAHAHALNPHALTEYFSKLFSISKSFC